MAWGPSLKRFWKYTRKSADGCWNWLGHCDKRGYARFRFNGGRQLAHRFAYEQWIGPIPVGCDLHHKCENPSCVNPEHLEPLTHVEHAHLSTAGKPKPWLHRSRCPRGHPLSGDNLISNGKERRCRECQRLKAKLKYRGLCLGALSTEEAQRLINATRPLPRSPAYLSRQYECRVKNRQTINSRSREHYIQNHEALLTKQRAHRTKNREAINAKAREYYAKRREAIVAKIR